jgi:hypothetical protein
MSLPGFRAVRAAVVARAAARPPIPLGLFASFPISQIEVVSDQAGGSHAETMRLASEADVPVIDVAR